MQMELVSKVVPLTVIVFVVSSMLSVGLSLSIGEILVPLRSGKLVLLALLINFVLMPLLAFGLARLLRLDRPLGVALLVLGTAAGSPMLLKWAAIARANLAFAVSLTVLLMVLTVGYMPSVLPMLLEGVSVDSGKIARSLVLLMLLPLAVGFAVKARYAGIAARLGQPLNSLSTLSLALMIVLLLATNVRNILNLFGTRGILASILFLVAGFGIAWFIGGPDLATKRVLALGAAQRNISAAFVVGSQDFSDPNVVVMLAVVTIVGVLVLMPLARVLAKRNGEQPRTALPIS